MIASISPDTTPACRAEERGVVSKDLSNNLRATLQNEIWSRGVEESVVFWKFCDERGRERGKSN